VTAVLTRQQPGGLVTVAGAASMAVRVLVLGPSRPVAVLAAFPSAIYLSTGDGAVVALVTNDAVRLPCAIVVGTELPDLSASATWVGGSLGDDSAGRARLLEATEGASVGAGAVAVGRLRVEVARWWLPMPPAPPPDSAVLARGLSALSERLAVQQHRLLRVVAEPTRRLEAAVRTRDTRVAAEATTALLGLGPGLTPSGDDVLAGMLVGLHHLEWARADWRPPDANRANGRAGHGHVSVASVRDAIASRVLSDAPRRTTTLSAALLAHAAHGEAAGEVTAVLNSLCGRRPLSPALMRLLAVGHSSGYDMACGILAAGRALLGQRDSG
jgi:Protein of unknown function (DUF2877)